MLLMDKHNQIQKLYNEEFHLFFQTKFVNQDVMNAFYLVFKETLINFTHTYIKFTLILDSLKKIKLNINIYKGLSQETKINITKNIKLLEHICYKIECILDIICNHIRL